MFALYPTAHNYSASIFHSPECPFLGHETHSPLPYPSNPTFQTFLVHSRLLPINSLFSIVQCLCKHLSWGQCRCSCVRLCRCGWDSSKVDSTSDRYEDKAAGDSSADIILCTSPAEPAEALPITKPPRPSIRCGYLSSPYHPSPAQQRTTHSC